MRNTRVLAVPARHAPRSYWAAHVKRCSRRAGEHRSHGLRCFPPNDGTYRQGESPPFRAAGPEQGNHRRYEGGPPRWAPPPQECEGVLEVAQCGRLRRPRAFAATSGVRNAASTAVTSTACSRAPFTCSLTICRCRAAFSITLSAVSGGTSATAICAATLYSSIARSAIIPYNLSVSDHIAN